MNVELIQGSQAFTRLAGEWDQLARRGMTDTPFQSFAYQESWWRNLAPEDGTLLVITTRDPGGVLTAIAPLYLQEDGVIHFNGCVEETDYLDLIVEARHAQAAWTAVLDCLFSAETPAWRLLELCNIPALSPSRTILGPLASARGVTVVESIDEVCPVITLPATFDAYLDSLDSKQRREISRKLRRAAGADMKLRVISPDDDLPQAVNDFLDLLQLSTLDKRDWLNDGRRALFLETAVSAQENGTLQLMFVEVEGRKAAALFNFDYRDRVWVYNSGLDPQAFSALSPGVVLTAWAIEWAIQNGRSEFDFLRGSESYKYRFGAQDTTIYRLQINHHSPQQAN